MPENILNDIGSDGLVYFLIVILMYNVMLKLFFLAI